MKLLIVHSRYADSSNSGENSVVLAQAEALKNAGHQVVLLTKDTTDQNLLTAIKAGLRVATGIGPDPLENLEGFAPDLIHVHNLFPNWGTRWLKETHGVPIFTTVHNFRPLCSAATLFRDGASCTLCPSSASSTPAVAHRCYRNSRVATLPLAWQSRNGGRNNTLINNSDLLIFLSNRAASTYSTYLPIKDRYAVLPNFSESGDPSAHTTRKGWLFVGRLTSEKGIDRLVDAWPPNERLKIIGSGPLQELIKHKCQSMPNIQLLGNRHPVFVRDSMRQAEGLIFPSLWPEGLPTVYLEALSEGLPVVATPNTTVADCVIDEESGVIMNIDDPLSALNAVRADWTSLSSAAVAAHELHYSKVAWLSSIEGIYSTLLGNIR